ncbi:GNAT family N-acetyltransferase [Pseudonocardia spinosispora]|uniref:GNAT family N-acetyltransferase n=1 Tax=Pseudonocardia spinosispora TaxID=103441 RepID=UPI0006881073|nr:GNAT family N-acetyltransferase [Pseudonocardia spinosispora]
MGIRSLRVPEDIQALSHLGTASHAGTVFRVSATSKGFQLTEQSIPRPLIKNHEFVTEVTDPDRRWTDGFVAVEGTSIVGFAATGYQRWNRRQVLWHLYVDHLHRARGIGRRLIEHVMFAGRNNGARHLWLETQNTNVLAVRAYQAMGFELVGLDRTLYDGDYAHETALYFAKPL